MEILDLSYRILEVVTSRAEGPETIREWEEDVARLSEDMPIPEWAEAARRAWLTPPRADVPEAETPDPDRLGEESAGSAPVTVAVTVPSAAGTPEAS